MKKQLWKEVAVQAAGHMTDPERIIDVANTVADAMESKFKEDNERESKALDLIVKYGGIDGDHHKAWVLDQVARILAGDEYEKIVTELDEAGYGWDTGIAP